MAQRKGIYDFQYFSHILNVVQHCSPNQTEQGSTYWVGQKVPKMLWKNPKGLLANLIQYGNNRLKWNIVILITCVSPHHVS